MAVIITVNTTFLRYLEASGSQSFMVFWLELLNTDFMYLDTTQSRTRIFVDDSILIRTLDFGHMGCQTDVTTTAVDLESVTVEFFTN